MLTTNGRLVLYFRSFVVKIQSTEVQLTNGYTNEMRMGTKPTVGIARSQGYSVGLEKWNRKCIECFCRRRIQDEIKLIKPRLRITISISTSDHYSGLQDTYKTGSAV